MYTSRTDEAENEEWGSQAGPVCTVSREEPRRGARQLLKLALFVLGLWRGKVTAPADVALVVLVMG